MAIRTALRELLAKNSQSLLVEELLRELPEISDAESIRPIALCEVKDIYRARAKRYEMMGAPIKGFPDLLAGLETFSRGEIVVYTVHSEKSSYKIFATEAQTESAGILKLPAVPSASVIPARPEFQTA